MKRRIKKPITFTYRQKKLIDYALSGAMMLHDSYCMHDEWSIDMDCDLAKFVKKTQKDFQRALNLFYLKTKHIRKPRKRKKKTK